MANGAPAPSLKSMRNKTEQIKSIYKEWMGKNYERHGTLQDNFSVWLTECTANRLTSWTSNQDQLAFNKTDWDKQNI